MRDVAASRAAPASRAVPALSALFAGAALLAGAALVLPQIAAQLVPPFGPPAAGAHPGAPPALHTGGVVLALAAAALGGLWAGTLTAQLAGGTRALLALGLLTAAVRLAPLLAGQGAAPGAGASAGAGAGADSGADLALRLRLADLGITLLGLSWGGVLARRLASRRTAGRANAAGVLTPRGLFAVFTAWTIMLGGSRLCDEAALLAAGWAAGRGAPAAGESGWSESLSAWAEPLLFAQLVGAALACLLAGSVVARLAASAPRRHAALLAALVALWSLLGLSATRVMHGFDSQWSGWLFVAGAVLWPACAFGGALLPRATARERTVPTGAGLSGS